MRTSRGSVLGLCLALAVGLGWSLSAPDPVFPVHAHLDQPRSDSSTQPVDVMNWLIDENGNLRVSNQVRTQYIALYTGSMTLTEGEDWYSDEFNVAEFQTALVVAGTETSVDNGVKCTIEYKWSGNLPWLAPSSTADQTFVARFLSDGGNRPKRFDIEGESARIRCWHHTYGDNLNGVHVLLRAE